MTILRILVLLVAYLMVVLPESARACTCSEMPLQAQIASSQFVFVGTVERVSIVEPPQNPSARARIFLGGHPIGTKWHAQYRAQEVLKGNTEQLPVVWSYDATRGCGMYLNEGRTYIFFVPSSGEVSACAGARLHVPGNNVHETTLQGLRQLLAPDKRSNPTVDPDAQNNAARGSP